MSVGVVARSVPDATALAEREYRFASMGGWVRLRVTTPLGAETATDRELRLVAGRIQAWADRITRFDAGSELMALNRGAQVGTTVVGPTIGHVLERARQLGRATDGLVDVALLEARLAAEHGGIADAAEQPWRLERSGRTFRVHREGPSSFDLDGVGKGWIADRALALLARYPAAMVDADGDVALRTGSQDDWAVAIADPWVAGADLAVVRAPASMAGPVGIATSGTSVHRWEREDGWAHHLIDPRSGTSAHTDVVQATVVAHGALEAEALAKAVVIAGSEEGLRLLQRTGAHTGLIYLQSGELIAPPGVETWLA
jgi:thiamine biosynthesis lipoprotein